MIRKQDILDRASEWQLRPNVVEKDYVLGWLLASIAQHPVVQNHWVFKGGTCLKKCYLETYRFSEDLDFSLLPEAPYSEKDIEQVLRDVTETTQQMSGIQFPTDLIAVATRQDKLARPTFQGKISYQGPLGQIHSLPRIIFDITQHELVLSDPIRRSIFHAYPDDLPTEAQILSYSLPELLAEKTRALYERTRPRDLYDVDYLLSNRSDDLDFSALRDLFLNKCKVKNLEMPSAKKLTDLAVKDEELKSEWKSMLAHQLPVLPKLEDFLNRLGELIIWIDTPVSVSKPQLGSVSTSGGVRIEGESYNPAGIQYWGGGASLETIRFAGANRLILEFGYHGKHRLVEPYSLRRASTGNLLLYAWEIASGHIKAFKVSEMSGARATEQTFSPRYQIEFTASGSLNIPSTHSLPRSYPTHSARKSSASSWGTGGKIYVYECTYCDRKFKRKKSNSTLRKHKDKDGWDCSGRQGYLIDTEWT